MKRVEVLLNRVNILVTFIGGLAIALMMIHVSLDVLARFIFNSPLPGTIAIVAHYYMPIAIFLPLAYAEQTNSTITVEILTTKFSKMTQYRLKGWTYLLICIVATLMTKSTLKVALKNYSSKTSVMQGDYSIITWPSYFILFGGVFLLAIYSASQFFSFLANTGGVKNGGASHD